LGWHVGLLGPQLEQQPLASGPSRLPHCCGAPELLELELELPLDAPQTSVRGTQRSTCWPSALLTAVHARSAAQLPLPSQEGAQYVSPPSCPHRQPCAQSASATHGGHAAPAPPAPVVVVDDFPGVSSVGPQAQTSGGMSPQTNT
jgi:hypothetical protein